MASVDVVLFLGVFYRMIDPIMVLKNVASLANELLVIETHEDLLTLNRPAMVFYPGATLNGDGSNWWGPNPACVTELLATVEFHHVFYQRHPKIACRGIYHAFRSTKTAEHYLRRQADHLTFSTSDRKPAGKQSSARETLNSARSRRNATRSWRNAMRRSRRSLHCAVLPPGLRLHRCAPCLPSSGHAESKAKTPEAVGKTRRTKPFLCESGRKRKQPPSPMRKRVLDPLRQPNAPDRRSAATSSTDIPRTSRSNRSVSAPSSGAGPD